MNWADIDFDHVKSISILDVSKDEGLRQAFVWRNTHPSSKHNHQYNGTKIEFSA